jgi:hypothetical protein
VRHVQAAGSGRAGAAALNHLGHGWRRWVWVYAAVLATIVLAHAPELTGWVTCGPLQRSGAYAAAPLTHVLPGSCVIDANDGITLLDLGGAAARQWLHGTLPWWNSDAGLGLPLAAEAQPAAFFLPFVLLLRFTAGILLLKLSVQAVAGGFMVALLRQLGLRRAACLVGGVLFALHGSFAWYAHSPILPVAFLPALLFGILRCRADAAARRWPGAVWVAVALAYSLVAGFPETAFMDGLFAGLWAIVALARTPGHRVALALRIGAGGLAGLALSAPAWVSFLDYLRIAAVGLHLLVSGNYLVASQALTLLLPGAYGPPYADFVLWPWGQDGGYFGPAAAVLALAALAGGRRAPAALPATLRWAVAAWVVVWLGVFFRVPGLYALWSKYPPLNLVQVTRYAMPSLECGVAILAAAAVEDWWRGTAGRRMAYAAGAFGVLLLVTLWFAQAAGRLPVTQELGLRFLRVALLEAICVAAGLTWLGTRRPHRRAALLLVALVAMDASLHFMLPQLPGARPEKPARGAVDYLRGHAGLQRVYALGGSLLANDGSWFGIPQIQADSVPYAQAWDDAARAIGGDINLSVTGWLVITPGSQLAAFRAAYANLLQAGVGYVMAEANGDPFVAAPMPGMAAAYADAHAHIYAVPGAPYAETRGAACRLFVETRTKMRSDCAAPAVLVRRELLLPGWQARVNGRKVSITAADGKLGAYFQQVALPAGMAEITFRYAPPHAKLMAWLFAAGLAACLGMGVPWRRRA